MKHLIIGLLVLTVFACESSDTKNDNMKEARIIEMVMWKSVEGISPEEAKRSITKLNSFVSQEPGFVSRKTALAEDGNFLDIVYWTDLKSAKNASEKAMQTEDLIPIFSTIDENEMLFNHFQIFNEIKE